MMPVSGAVLVLLFPVGLAVASVPAIAPPVLARALLAVSVLPGLLIALAEDRVRRRWAALLAVFFLGQAAAAVAAWSTGSSQAEQGRDIVFDLGRQAFMLAFAFLLTRVLASEAARKKLSFGMALLCGFGAAVVVWAYLRFAGWSWLGFGELAELKTYAMADLGLGLNGLALGSLLAGALALTWAEGRPLRLGYLGAVTAVVLLLSGARATVIMALAGALIYGALRAFRAFSPLARVMIAIVVSIILAVGAVFLGGDGGLADPYALSRATTGRFDLWVAGFRKFLDYPVFGGGAGSWRYDLRQYLPNYREWGVEAFAEKVQAGAYHNSYLTLLAEKGLVSFLPGIALLVFVVRRALAASLQPGADLFVRSAPAVMSALLVATLAETMGFFGSANGPADFLAYGMAAYLVAVSEEPLP